MTNDKIEKTICELFAGVGGFRLGFERLNSGWETVWFSQWEPSQKAQYAHDCYINHFGDSEDLNGEYHTNDDISTVDKDAIPDHTLLVGGFPCQDYSVAQSLSTSKGIEGKKGVLWWQIMDTIEAKKPAFCIFENVDRIITSPAKQRGRDFGIILACLYDLGYSVEWRVVNAAKYGGAQKRRRTFIFAYRDDSPYGIAMADMSYREIIERSGFMVKSFPIETTSDYKQILITDDILEVSDNFTFKFGNAGYMHLGKIYTTRVTEVEERPIPLSDILETDVAEEYYLTKNKIEAYRHLKGKKSIPRVSKTGHKYVFSEGSIPFPDPITEPGRTILTGESLTSRSTHVVEDPETGRLRVLTPIEVERLQGFDDNWTDTGMSKRARYFCMGNALVVPMVTRMAETLDDIMETRLKMDDIVKPFLYDYQLDAVNRMKNGCILNGGVGSGKSRTSLYYYFTEQGGRVSPDYSPMTNPKPLYIITTARKRDTLEWEGELIPFLIDKKDVVIDSWNNIKKYQKVFGAFFIFDEQKVCGSGAWVKAFYDITRKNDWILLSATPGDVWMDYFPVFKANGFFKTKKEFQNEHCVYSRFAKYPKIERYYNTGKLLKYRNSILIDMDFNRNTVRHHEDVWCGYDNHEYKSTLRNRWNPYTNEPIQNASELCYLQRKLVNSDESRQVAILEIFEKHPRMIVFYSFDYELDILKSLYYGEDVTVAEWNGHLHQPVPSSDKWVYLVNYASGAEAWNCITTDTIVFYSQTYSYKILEQACGRIDRVNTPFKDLYYFHLKSKSSIDLRISRALRDKKNFNESKYYASLNFAESRFD